MSQRTLVNDAHLVAPPSQPLRVLLVEDSADDATLLIRDLYRGGFDVTCERVDTAAALGAALAWQDWDIVISDYAMPHFSGLAALALVRDCGRELPFILVSGTIGEETAVQAMKAGAHDYIMKGNLTRLVAAVQRELREAAARRERRQVEETLRLRDRAIEAISQGVLITDPSQPTCPIIYANAGFTNISGYAAHEVIGRNPSFLQGPDSDPAALKVLQSALRARRECTVELLNYRKDGTPFWNALSIAPVRNAAGDVGHFVGVLTDVTHRKAMEATLREEAEISAAHARVGRELISSFNLPRMLDQLCALTVEVVGSDSSHLLLSSPGEHTLAAVSHCGDTAEQWEARRLLHVPHAALADLLARLDREDAVQVQAVEPVRPPALPIGAFLDDAVTLCVALRRGDQIVGILTAGWHTPGAPCSSRQMRIAQGIGQLASMALENARLVEETERANSLKADFVATMSHELRTPLNVILGYHDLLLGGDFGSLTALQVEPLQRADKSARELLDLINATLDLSRLEAGQLPFKLTTVAPQDFFDELITETRFTNTNPDLKLVWEIPPQLPNLHTDPLKLKIVLKNLISNAVKFTEHGSITVAAETRNDGIDIRVSDTGIGVAPDALPIIFEPFRQVDGSSTRSYGGVGLGLYIVRRLTDLLGATVSVDSQVGRGSTFHVWIPSTGCGRAELRPPLEAHPVAAL